MKILMIDQKSNPFLLNSVCGGVEQSFKTQMRLLSESGCQVGVFISKDSSDPSDYFDVHPYYSSIESKYNSNVSGQQYNKIRNTGLVHAIRSFRPDVVVNHDQSNSSVLRILNEEQVPSITYVHNTPEVMGGMAGISYLEELKRYSGLVVHVSKSSMDKWNVYGNKGGNNGFDTYQHIFVNYEFHDHVLPLTERKFLILSRMSQFKKVHSMVKWCGKANKKFGLVYSRPKRDKEVEYQTQVFKEFRSHAVHVGQSWCDLPRGAVISILRSSEFLLVAGPESFGMVGVEANLCGVPVALVNPQENHPILEACGPGSEFGSVVQYRLKAGQHEFLSELQELSYTKRRILCDATREYYSPEKSWERMSDILQQSLRRG